MIETLQPGVVSGSHALVKAASSITQESEGNAVASFAVELARTIQAGEAAAMRGIKGEMPLQEVVENVMEAERALTTAVSIRDKIITAYNEITRMQI